MKTKKAPEGANTVDVLRKDENEALQAAGEGVDTSAGAEVDFDHLSELLKKPPRLSDVLLFAEQQQAMSPSDGEQDQQNQTGQGASTSNECDRLDATPSTGSTAETLSPFQIRLPKPIKARGPRSTENKYLTKEEVDTFFRVVTKPRDIAIFRLAYHRGLRATEIGNLQYAHVSWDERRLLVPRLNGSNTFEYRLTTVEFNALLHYRFTRGYRSGPLFLSRNGHGIKRTRLHELMQHYCGLAGIPPERAYMEIWRNSCGKHLAEKGAGLLDIKDHLGHRNVRNTMAYLEQRSSLEPTTTRADKITPGTARKRRRATIKYLTRQEVGRFFQVVTSPRDIAIFRLAYHRGLSACEIGKLQISHFCSDRCRLAVERREGSDTVSFRLSEIEMEALHDHIRIRGFKPGPLFLSREGNGMSRVRLHELMKRYCALAGIPEKKAHMQMWKHSYGKHLAKQGADILEIQDQLGHRTVHNVMEYVGIKASRREAFAYSIKNWK